MSSADLLLTTSSARASEQALAFQPDLGESGPARRIVCAARSDESTTSPYLT